MNLGQIHFQQELATCDAAEARSLRSLGLPVQKRPTKCKGREWVVPAGTKAECAVLAPSLARLAIRLGFYLKCPVTEHCGWTPGMLIQRLMPSDGHVCSHREFEFPKMRRDSGWVLGWHDSVKSEYIAQQ